MRTDLDKAVKKKVTKKKVTKKTVKKAAKKVEDGESFVLAGQECTVQVAPEPETLQYQNLEYLHLPRPSHRLKILLYCVVPVHARPESTANLIWMLL